MKAVSVIAVSSLLLMAADAADIIPKPHRGNLLIPTHVKGRRSVVSAKKQGVVVVTPFPSVASVAYLLVVTEGPVDTFRVEQDGAVLPISFDEERDGMIAVPNGAEAPFTLYIDYKGERHTFPFGLKEEL